MSRKDMDILRVFADSVRSRFPEARVWGFGSRARGDYSDCSDLDVCVVVNNLDESADSKIIETAWLVGFEHDMVISTVTYSADEFERGPCSESALIQSILKEGVAA